MFAAVLQFANIASRTINQPRFMTTFSLLAGSCPSRFLTPSQFKQENKELLLLDCKSYQDFKKLHQWAIDKYEGN